MGGGAVGGSVYANKKLKLIQDFFPFIALLADERVTKVLHTSGEDLEVFQHYFQQLSQSMCDTQVVANFLGFANSPGFATLVQHYFQIEIDKGASRTDWLARPLSDTQLQYAARYRVCLRACWCAACLPAMGGTGSCGRSGEDYGGVPVWPWR